MGSCISAHLSHARLQRGKLNEDGMQRKQPNKKRTDEAQASPHAPSTLPDQEPVAWASQLAFGQMPINPQTSNRTKTRLTAFNASFTGVMTSMAGTILPIDVNTGSGIGWNSL
ncbi:hypothetical protein FALCPG4_001140 [Fusarium falciforme]